jgi:iron uptake system component EfeO
MESSRMPRYRFKAGLGAVAVAATFALATTACGGSSTNSGAAGASAGAEPASVTTVKVDLTPSGCPLPTATIAAGPVTFKVTNTSADAVTEYEVLSGDTIMGEKENLAVGLSGEFSLSLKPGKYTGYCPDATTEKSAFTVTGAAATSSTGVDPATLTAATDGYAAYVKDQSAQLTRATQAFIAALAAGDVSQAKALYAPARVFYERIEPVAESFGDLDPEIDARAGDVPAAQWTGFHKIEQILYTKNTTAGTAALGTKLVADVQKLQGLVATSTYQPAQLANGATELLDEVAKSKITGEEERYSHVDLVDFQANVDGSKEAYNLLLPALTKINPTLAATVTARFAAVETLLAKYRSGDGFVLYPALTPTDVRSLATAVDALAEPLSQVAGQIVGA